MLLSLNIPLKARWCVSQHTAPNISGGSNCVCDSLSCLSRFSFGASVSVFVSTVSLYSLQQPCLCISRRHLRCWQFVLYVKGHGDIFPLPVWPVIWCMQASCSGLSGRVHASQRGTRACDLPQTGPVDRTLSPDIFHVTYSFRPCCQELPLVWRTWYYWPLQPDFWFENAG